VVLQLAGLEGSQNPPTRPGAAAVRPISLNAAAGFVAIEMTDGRGQVRQFLRRTHDGIFVRRFHPEQELRLPAPGVKRMYRITGSAELG
jgi:hypothetical protein